MSARIPWDKYEAAILLDAVVDVENGNISRIDAINQVSNTLRQIAIDKGLEIDDIYRNENGIAMQMTIMSALFNNQSSGLHNASRLFYEMVELYRNNNELYKQILKAAKGMTSGKKNYKEDFLKYVTIKAPQIAERIYYAMNQVEQYTLDTKIFTCSFFEILSPDTISILYNKVAYNKNYINKNKKISRFFKLGLSLLSEFIESNIEPYPNLTIETINDIPNNEQSFSIKEVDTLDRYRLKSPTRLLFFEKEINVNSWAILFATFLSEANEKYPFFLDDYYKKQSLNVKRLVKKEEVFLLTKPVLIPNTIYYVETNIRAIGLLRAIQKFCNQLCIDVTKVIISCGDSVKTHNKSQQLSDKVSLIIHPTNVDAAGISKVLKENYKYGFKYESIRELMRFRQFAEKMEIPLPEDDEQLKAAIISFGTIIDDKVFYKNDDLSQELCGIINSIHSDDVHVIYYEMLYEKHLSWMETHFIPSEDMLKEYLQKHIIGWTFLKKFMVIGKKQTEREAVTDEIKRVWGSEQTRSVDDLSECLPYIPVNNIWRVISGNDNFVLVSDGVYLNVEHFHITEEEEDNVLDYVETTCKEEGFAALNNIPLNSIEEENYELPQFAIYKAIYKKVLSGRYHLNGRILTIDKPNLDAVMLLKQFLINKEECTFDELAAKVVEFTGVTNRQYAFQALYDDMVRVDNNRFISDKLVNFDVDEIDKVLSTFIKDRFCAIQDITTFAMFPICGQTWNHYLLESYCYKYSRKYSLHVIHFNDRNAGIIAEKDFSLKYNEMLAIALSKTDVELTAEAIGSYLFNAGYMAKRKYAKLDEIAQRAQELRKER